MARRIMTAREQLRFADFPQVSPDKPRPGHPGGPSPVIPSADKNIGENTPWSQTDWRTADDYGAFHSSSRPPMSSDIPHPSEIFDPNKKAHQPKLQRAMASEDPKNDPYGLLNGTPWGFEDLVNNHVSHQLNANPDQNFQGKTWYAAAHDATKDVAQKTIGDHERAVAVTSALSPVKDWDLNNEQAVHYLLNYEGQEGYKAPTPNMKGFSRDAPERDPENRFRVKAPNDQNQKAHDLMNAPAGSLSRDDYLKMLAGPKTSSFFNNILDDTPLREPRQGVDNDEGYYQHQINPNTGEPDWRYGDQDVTVDTHHARVQTNPHGGDLSELSYQTPPHFQEKFTVGGQAYHPGYDLHARASAEATRRINAMSDDPAQTLKPKQAQAGPWVKFKQDVINAGVSPNMPEPGTAPKSFNPAKPNKLTGPYPGEQDQPRYQKDRGDFWVHPGRPDVDPRTMPNWGRRSSLERTAATDDWLHSWIAGNFPHRAQGAGMDTQQIAANLAHCGYCGVDRRRMRHEASCPSVTHAPVSWNDPYLPRQASPRTASKDPVQAALDAVAYSDAIVKNAISEHDLSPEWGRERMKEVQDSGGFSRRGPQGPPDAGYMVALPHTEQVQPSKSLTEKDLRDYGTKHMREMQDDPDLYQGGWDSGDEYFHDMSKHHDNIWDAAGAAYGDNPETAQHGFYDIGTGESPSPLEFHHDKNNPGLMNFMGGLY
ncbi:hypothetical protein SEA_SCENTAE_100 [Gordonia phage SCentae]|nr:hypothetical protein SEA_SCENTAE_100 [Gordonia phage SCentae]